ncbi:MAG: alpha/beta hydrolase [Flavobacteriia bacterium]|nr:alpha/beta hydrolase [Flavobacteriia bacterium]OIP47767.1 MAG: 2-succinyl-6-hydroxy-2,4-cyclohexadiene-1-carboxylate synthase [Flavobacteriaceae bacterium CG2_30_31_66]PIV97457.1 MAG: 2-succinyl-6-hydroxy-2,4-cyclohexadiene-1-carboxylate synthase [Flavobacteriaceae bacterium CG17_big_fil_post_rev_8_21_14_2_50_31_13]PIX13195.1 MAG: 2-succinyl-6-hydroxy-2,4-cyclohexadiene-1-carboxylate synthase [Flavobacteriaceae bacterium CG_4_8_14_3_um_filter_31_8]PIY14816.1 MAG: 2-succinyl-6-hydroxy-2,4-cyc
MLNYYTYPNSNSSEWVTFVHGAGGSSSIWYKQVRDFKKEFNVLILDLRGHGNSKPTLKDTFNPKYTFDSITHDIVEVIEHLNIRKSHFIGISLGTILIRNLAEKRPEMVKSMIMGGAIIKLNFRSQMLMKIGNIFKSVVPYMMLYKLFAFIIMPKKNHKNSRLLFVNEAKKLYQKEFLRWFKLTAEINPLLRFFRAKDIKIPTFYIMGAEDHLFLPSIKHIVSQHVTSTLFVVENCGHVVNVEQPEMFNCQTIRFINSLA